MSESDFLTTDDVEALANLVEMIAQDEEGAVDKAHGEAILAMTKDAREGRNCGRIPSSRSCAAAIRLVLANA